MAHALVRAVSFEKGGLSWSSMCGLADSEITPKLRGP
jgi:hypothetical protein